MSVRPGVRIAANYSAPPSMFSRRDAAGGYAHTLPPMSADDERLQRALTPPLPEPHAGDRLVGWTCYLGLVFIVIAGAFKWI